MIVQADLLELPKDPRPEQPNERYTPRSLFGPLEREFRFTLDACATAESAKCARFFSREDNGLIQSWTDERVWCNPPWDDIPAWLEKTRWEMGHACELAVNLLPAWTDRSWWQSYVEPYRDGRGRPARLVTLETRFLPGRIRFGHPGNPDGAGVDSPPFWCVLCIWRQE